MRTSGQTPVFLVIYFLLSFAILFADTKNWLSRLHTLGQYISDPVKSTFVQTKDNTKLVFSFTKAREREEKILILEQENLDLLSKLGNYKFLEDENREMRRLLDAGLSQKWKFSPAQVVSKLGDALFLVSDYSPPKGTPIIISQETNSFISGEIDGENPKKAGIYIGRVEDIVGSQIKAIRPTDINSKIPASVRDSQTLDKRASGILEGRGGKIVLEQVTSDETLKVGDLVFTTGEANLPPELLLGRVLKILNDTNTALQQAEVTPALNTNKLNIVFFLTKF